MANVIAILLCLMFSLKIEALKVNHGFLCCTLPVLLPGKCVKTEGYRAALYALCMHRVAIRIIPHCMEAFKNAVADAKSWSVRDGKKIKVYFMALLRL